MISMSAEFPSVVENSPCKRYLKMIFPFQCLSCQPWGPRRIDVSLLAIHRVVPAAARHRGIARRRHVELTEDAEGLLGGPWSWLVGYPKLCVTSIWVCCDFCYVTTRVCHVRDFRTYQNMIISMCIYQYPYENKGWWPSTKIRAIKTEILRQWHVISLKINRFNA